MPAAAAACGKAAPKLIFEPIFLEDQMMDASTLRSGKGHRDENFPVASFLIHPRHREPILAFYNFVRTADDIADHAALAAPEKLALLDRLDGGLTGANDDDAVAVRLRQALNARGLSPKHAQDLLTAFRLDVTKLRYRDWDDLMSYCAFSAMPVGRFVCDVHGESRAVWPANDALCAALQVINHLQDCKQDYLTLNRVYIPQDALGASGANVEALGEARASPALRDCLRRARGAHRGAAHRERRLCRRDRRLAALPRSLGHQYARASAHAYFAPARSAQRESASRHCRRCRRHGIWNFARRFAIASAGGLPPARTSRGVRECKKSTQAAERAVAAARFTPACAFCRAASARRCSKSTRSAAPSTISPTIPARATGALRHWRPGAATSPRSMPAPRRRGLRGLPARCAISIFSARIFSPSLMAWRWMCAPISARPIALRSMSIATASPAPSAGYRCAYSACRARRDLRLRTISAALCN